MAEISRKEFLKGVGKTVAGVTVVGALGSVLTGCTTAEPTAAVPVTPERPQWPFPYKKLDAEKVLARGFKGYKDKGG
jgi:hypothetical protein